MCVPNGIRGSIDNICIEVRKWCQGSTGGDGLVHFGCISQRGRLQSDKCCNSFRFTSVSSTKMSWNERDTVVSKKMYDMWQMPFLPACGWWDTCRVSPHGLCGVVCMCCVLCVVCCALCERASIQLLSFSLFMSMSVWVSVMCVWYVSVWVCVMCVRVCVWCECVWLCVSVGQCRWEIETKFAWWRTGLLWRRPFFILCSQLSGL